MKILLLGEFSALHKNLKEGLVELGHNVTVASSGDGWKNISSDINISTASNNLFLRFLNFFKLFINVLQFRNYDVVQFISPVIFPRSFGVNKLLTKYILLNNKKSFLCGAGCNDSITADFFMEKYKYPDFYKVINNYNKGLWCQTDKGRTYNAWFLKQINGYIPIMYEYAQGYRNINFKKLCPTIPIPMNIDKIKMNYNKLNQNDKVTIFHGITRSSVKGTCFIKEAMSLLKEKYPDRVDCIIDGNMSLDSYLTLLENVDIVVDQVYSVSSGVNGVYNMAMGKIVLGGGEDEYLTEHKLDNSPLIPISPSVNDIYLKLESLVLDKNNLFEKQTASRSFVLNTHHYINVAQNYIDVWSDY